MLGLFHACMYKWADLAKDVISNEARREPGISEYDLRVLWEELEDMIKLLRDGVAVGMAQAMEMADGRRRWKTVQDRGGAPG